MSHWKIIGEYLGREIRIGRFANLDQDALDSLSDSLLLIALEDDLVSEGECRRMLEILVNHQPLAIVVFGVGTEKVFDLLISILSDGRKLKQIMTKSVEETRIELAIEDFLCATWPSNERFDEWKSYSILSVGKSVAAIERAVSGFVD